MNKFMLMVCFLLAACASGSKVVTQENFVEVERGITASELKARLGTPNEIRKLDSGDAEYIYFERVQANDEVVEVKQYIFIIRQGRVFDKKMRFEKMQLPYRILERNAFDLQTSQNQNIDF